MITGAKILVDTLKENNVEYIFGVPGDIEGEFFKELKNSGITFFNTMHEQSGAMMADVYSRLTGKLGVCFSTLGPGATNMLTGIANAHQDRSSVLAISGQLPLKQQYRDSHQYIDLEVLFKPITKSTKMIYKAKDINSTINELINIAETETRGPVHVSIPVNVLSETEKTYRTIKSNKKVIFDYDKQLDQLIKLAEEANSIVAIIGNGVIRSNSNKKLQKFLEHYDIPFYTSFQGKGAIRNDHRLNCGVLSRHSQVVKKVLGKQDLIITFGFDVIEGVTQDVWSGAKNIVHIDSNTPTGDNTTYYPDVEIIGDINDVLDKLETKPINNLLLLSDTYLKTMKISASAPDGIDNMFPFHPAKIMKDLKNVLSDDDIVVSDVGLHKQAIGLYYEINRPNQAIFSNGLSTMGFALPASMAAKIAHPEKKVVAICGDGGFQMNIQELATAVENKLPIVYIVMNDGAYGMVKNKQLETTGTYHAAEFKEVRNFEKIAKGFGAIGTTVNSTEELIPTLKRALKSERVCVIDIPIQQYSDIEMMK